MMTRFAPLPLAILALAATSAHAADIPAGDWTVSIGGNVNAFYTSSHCTGSQSISGLALAGQALGCAGTDSRTVIGNGLLPDTLAAGVKGRQEGFDIGATIAISVATSSGDSISNNNNVDVRQAFFTVGNAQLGSFKLGRDYGLFGKSAILGDMTLVGAGATVAATQRNRVTLGHIGSGYSYLGTYGQFAWASPDLGGGVGVDLALVSPVDAYANTGTGKNQPQVQARLRWNAQGAAAWLGAKTQKFEGDGETAGFTMSGVEVGGSISAGDFGLIANLQSGKGLGVLADGDNGDGKQDAWFVQGTWQALPKTKLGLGYGQTRLKDGSGSSLRDNTNTTLGVYQSLTKSVTLTGELSQTRSRSFGGATAKMQGVVFGGIVFF